MKFPPRHHGFTLLEVIVVVAITSIVAVSGFSAIVNLQRTARVNDMYFRFGNFLDLARSYAINGKTVSGANSGCGVGSCVPKRYGVRIDANFLQNTCAGGGPVAVLFYQPLTLLTYEKNKTVTLDSFCIDPRITAFISTSQGVSTDIAFLYEPPFGTFSTSKPIGTSPEINTFFCDASGVLNTNKTSSCPSDTYQKIITLFANVGVPE